MPSLAAVISWDITGFVLFVYTVNFFTLCCIFSTWTEQYGKVFVIGDNREKYSYDKKLKVIRMYLEGVGIRSIERLEHISTPLILKWIKGVSKIIKNKLINTEVPDKLENIEILEIDEITDIFKKKTKDFGYGLLLTETGIKLLITK